MLELKHIVKHYPAGGGTVEALKGIDLRFRESEFVSILGPSGCGKTTLLNLIGGLDRYTEGDLVINGRSTKEYKARDWDTYRNHSIGFVFQSYNLIPHQTVLQNVELALTLTGVSKAERRRRAKKALEDVGLTSQLRKRPAQMSGGQMQRVAIARALVNDPDILLADEPTGALDTQTSVQVMELLKKISENRLVIVVTHNPELAETYSTRIIRMLDGEITADTNPLTEEEVKTLQSADKARLAEAKKQKKPSMSFFTAFGLSLKNLFTKKGRTILTAFAGSIGIIGIALILAVSEGTTNYINTVQEDTLSSYPLTLEAKHADMGSLMEAFIGSAKSGDAHEKDAVYQKGAIYNLMNAINNMETTENDLAAFKAYLEQRLTDAEDESGLREAVSGVQYSYAPELLIYTKNVDGTILRSDTQELMQELISEFMGMDMSSMTQMSGSSGMMSLFTPSTSYRSLWQELLPAPDGALLNELLFKQYDIVYGEWPTAYDEIVLVLDENNELDDMTLYALGLTSKEEVEKVMDAAKNGTELEVSAQKWSYEEICALEYRMVLNADCYIKDAQTGLFTDLRETDAGMNLIYDNAIPLKVTGIIRPSEDAVSSMLTGSIGYTTALTAYVSEHTESAPAVTAQRQTPDTDVFSGLPFRPETVPEQAEKAQMFLDRVAGYSEAEQAELYVRLQSVPDEEMVASAVEQAMMGMTRETVEQTMVQAYAQQTGMSEADILSYMGNMTDDELLELYAQAVAEQTKAQYAAQVQAQLSAVEPAQLAMMLTQTLDASEEETLAGYYDEILEFSDTSFEDNLKELGVIDLSQPSQINLYAATFAGKDTIEEAITAYNDGVEELEKIVYTDYVGLMMSSVTTIIDAITYVLIAFVAISLIVSSIMIGVITLISVQERTKEIGILRALGASKRDVSSMFNAETVIIGFTAGAIGVGVTYLLCIPINMILHKLTGINNLSAILPWQAALILVGISVLLTLFAGIIPSRSAAKKDPVVALRTE